MVKHQFRYKNESTTIFGCEPEEGIKLQQLFGMSCEIGSISPWVNGAFSLDTDKGSFLYENYRQCHTEQSDDGITTTYTDAGMGLLLKSVWTFCSNTGIWSRKDSLQNISTEKITVFRCLSRFSFAPGCYELYSQSSRWCNESQGGWQKLSHGCTVLGCEGGRTTQGSTPYLCIKDSRHDSGAVFHVVPNGNWVIKVFVRTAPMDSLPYAVAEMGLSDEHLRLCLKPGQMLELPEILIQELFDGKPQYSASRLHKYVLSRLNNNSVHNIPVVYNTWFDAFGDLKLQRLEAQLAAAKEIGFEVFTVDAGWYGEQEGDWGMQTGDWREKKDGAFGGAMKEFSDKVRSEGLGFGLWMEPERIGPNAPILKQHFDWFIDAGQGWFYPDLQNEEAYTYIKMEIYRLVDTYKLDWIKLDFNFDLGIDPYGSEFLWYFKAWYGLIEEIRESRPGLFLEACASGGMRLELMSLSHCDGHFISDTVNPLEVLNIFEGSILRLPPGRLTKWAVLRSAGRTVPFYGKQLEDSPETTLTPCGGTWEVCESRSIDFIVFSAMPGVLGVGGDIAGLPQSSKARLRELLEFYKKYRRLLYNSTADILTPMSTVEDHYCWHLIQMTPGCDEDIIIFAYRLKDTREKYMVKPLHLAQSQLYSIEYWNGEIISELIKGEIIMDAGMVIDIPERYGATAVVIKKCQ